MASPTSRSPSRAYHPISTSQTKLHKLSLPTSMIPSRCCTESTTRSLSSTSKRCRPRKRSNNLQKGSAINSKIGHRQPQAVSKQALCLRLTAHRWTLQWWARASRTEWRLSSSMWLLSRAAIRMQPSQKSVTPYRWPQFKTTYKPQAFRTPLPKLCKRVLGKGTTRRVVTAEFLDLMCMARIPSDPKIYLKWRHNKISCRTR